MGSMSDLSGARAVVTGGASGLGRAFCERLGRRGAQITIGDVDLAGAAETVERVKKLGGEAEAFECDVRDPAQVARLKEQGEDRFGPADLVVNNAGVAVGGPIGEVELDDWKWVVDINLWGVIYCCHTFVPDMKKRGRGYVINVASLAGLISAPQLGPYNVTKAGVVALSETLSIETKPFGVHVTVVCPSFFKTKIIDRSRGVIDEDANAAASKMMERSKVQAPDVADAALESVVAGRLYTVPMEDARAYWRLKRMSPHRFADFVGKLSRAERLQSWLGMKFPSDRTRSD